MDKLNNIEKPSPKDNKPNLLKEFGQSFANGAILNPVDAIDQLINKTTGAKLDDHLAYNLPKAKFNTASWYVQTAGSSLGALLPLIATSKLFSTDANATLAAPTSDFAFMTKTGSLGLSIKESALTGLTYGGLLTPSNNKNENLSSFLKARVENSLSSGLMFSTMTAGSIGLSKLAQNPLLNDNIFGAVLSKNVTNSILASLPASLLSTETTSLLNQHKLATSSQLWQEAYSMSLISAGFGMVNDIGLSKSTSILPEQLKPASLRPQIDPSLPEFEEGRLNNITKNTNFRTELRVIIDDEYPKTSQINPNVLELDPDFATKMITSKDGRLFFQNNFIDDVYLIGPNQDSHTVIYPGQRIEVNAASQLHLASVDGPIIKPFELESITFPQAFFDGKPLSFVDNTLNVGSAVFDPKDKDILDLTVSADHGKVTFSPGYKKFIYTDNSDNGTFVKNEDWQWIHLKKGQSMIVSQADEIHLGSKTGPLLKLTTLTGEKLGDGSVLFNQENGYRLYHVSGSMENVNQNGIGFRTDNLGRITRAFGPNNFEINYTYNNFWKLTKVEINHFDKYTTEFTSLDGRNFNGRIFTNETEFKTQPKPVNAKLSTAKDGSLIINSKDGDKSIYRADGSKEDIYKNGFSYVSQADLDSEISKFDNLIRAKFGDPEQSQRMLDLSESFLEARDLKGSSDKDTAIFFHHLNRLLETSTRAYLPEYLRSRLAEQVLFNASFPKIIDQGNNKTCNVTTLETRIYERSPQEAVRLIADGAIHGKTIALNGKIIDIARSGGLEPDKESLSVLSKPFNPQSNNTTFEDVKIDGRRNYANQILQHIAVNTYYSIFNMANARPGDIVQYTKITPPIGDIEDTGERLQLFRQNNGNIEVYTIDNSPYLNTGNLVELYNNLVPGFDAQHKPIPGSDNGFLVVGKDNAIHIVDKLKSGDVSYTDTAEHFDRFLKYAKTKNMFPLILAVDTSRDESIFGPFKGVHKAHVIVLHDIIEDQNSPTDPVKAEITNQWGSKFNFMGPKAIKSSQLFNSIF